ncbi:hypothetical protein glysoja_037136, partial [Glycine soja]
LHVVSYLLSCYNYLQGIIEVPTFYHQQWAPEYPEKDLSIYESMIIKFLACNNKSMFDLYFVPSLECQTCGRPKVMSRQHIWTVEITQSMLGAPGPLVTSQHMTILRRFGPPLQWNVVVVDGGVRRRYVVQPWYQFLADNDFSHGDEVSFYYRTIDKIWEIVIRRRKNWEY